MTHRAMTWLSSWLETESGPWRLLTLLLLLAALSSIALGLADVIRGLEFGLLVPVAILGLLIGWGLAATPWPSWLVGAVTAATGMAVIGLRLGRLEEALIRLLWAPVDLVWRSWSGPWDEAPLLNAWAELWAGINTLINRLFDWLLGLAAGEPAFDPLATALVWSLALWLAAAWAAWMVRRRDQPLLGLLPGGALLVISMSFGGGNFYFLLALLGLTWLLLALVGHAARERRWQATEIDFSLDIRLDLAATAIWLSLALVGIAQITPLISIQPVAQLAQHLIWGQPVEAGPVARSLGLQPRPGPPAVFDRVRVGGLPRRHLLGSGPELSQQVVMIVNTGAAHLTSASHPEPSPYYWRSLTYDRYTGRGWLAGRTKTVVYEAGEVISQTLELSTTSRVLTTYQQIQVVGDLGGLLHVAGALVTVDQPYQVAWRTAGDAFGATSQATTYRAGSLLTRATEAQLRAASSRYPEGVRRRYLALPDEVPARVLALARDLTATAPTPYDRARAIEAYLRAFPYDLNLPPPPSDQDVIDYFLFELQRGYCDYYATAMVVLARAAGLPARLVVGYAGGSYDPDAGRYLVTEADAHAWPELYFPDYGWIEFEPTASRPPWERPAESAPIMPPELVAAPPPALPTSSGLSHSWWWGLAAGVITLLLGSAFWIAADNWRLGHLPPPAAIEQLYQRLRRYGGRLAVPTEAGDTPYEFSAALAGRITGLAEKGRWLELLAPAAGAAGDLTDLYVRAAYSAHRPGLADRAQAVQSWQRLRWRLWLTYLRLRLDDFEKKIKNRNGA